MILRSADFLACSARCFYFLLCSTWIFVNQSRAFESASCLQMPLVAFKVMTIKKIKIKKTSENAK